MLIQGMDNVHGNITFVKKSQTEFESLAGADYCKSWLIQIELSKLAIDCGMIYVTQKEVGLKWKLQVSGF